MSEARIHADQGVGAEPPRRAEPEGARGPKATVPNRQLRVTRYYPRALTGDGGITHSVWNHSRALVRLGAHVTIAFDGDGPVETRDGIKLLPVRHRGSLWRAPVGLERGLEATDVLVLHSGWSAHNVRAGKAARRVGVSYVLEPRGAYDPGIVHRKRLRKRLWWLAWERRLALGASAIHLFFDSERAHLEALGYRGPTMISPNGVTPPADLQWDGGSGGYVLWLGRFDVEHKGLDLLLDGLGLLDPTERPLLRLVGPEARNGGKADLRRKVARMGLEKWVLIEEPVYGEAKWELMARARGFVFPSRWEAFGNAPAEAASLGLPLVLTPFPLGNLLATEGAAICVPPTPLGLAEGLSALGSSKALLCARRALCIAGQLTWERSAASWLAQIEEIL